MITYKIVTGEQISSFVPEIAKLRIEAFVEYPFLYEGDIEYEKKYLEKFFTMQDAIVIIAFDKEEIIGIATGYPFRYESDEMKKTFSENNRNPEEYYCYGESIVRKSYRMQGIGKHLSLEREKFARDLNLYHYICFFTREPKQNDPKRPENYRPLDPFWQKLGFAKHPELYGMIPYQEIGEAEETPKKMVYWIKELNLLPSG